LLIVSAAVAASLEVRGQPEVRCGQPFDRAWSRKPVSSAHHNEVAPPIRRGSHGARPQARTTSRPASWSSSASWMPSARADDHDPPGRELLRVPVAGRVDLEQRGGEQAAPAGRYGSW
jgi:hypothetical protein